MAIAFGTSGAAANGVLSVAVPYPASIAAGDLLVVSCVKKFNVTGNPTTPTGWTLAANVSGGAGADGADVGTIITSVFYKVADGTETGSLTVTMPASNNVGLARMFRYTKASTAVWQIANTTGADNTAGTAWSVTGAANPGIKANDVVLVTSGINTDAYTYSLEAISATSATFGTMVERQDSGTITGSDVGLVMSEHPVSSGTATAAPVYTMTASSTATNNPAGSSVILRLRENYPPTVALNTADAFDFGTDTTPTLEATGTDPSGDDVRYNFQIDTVNTFNSIAAVGKDSYLSAGSSTGEIHGTGGTNEAVAQSITPTTTYSIGSIDLKLRKELGSPTDNITVKIRTTSQTGTLLTTSNALSAASIPTTSGGTVTNITFPTPVVLSSGTMYFFVIERTGARDTSNYIGAYGDLTGNPYANGAWSTRSSSTWSDANAGAADFYFKLYTAAAPSIDKLSGTDAGFVNTVNGADTDPFTSGQKVSYTPTGLSNYYFDASDAAVTDPGGAWSSDANAFDSSESTGASTTINGSTSSNYLMAEGTSAPTSGGAITQVRARVKSSGDDIGGGASNTAIYTDGLGELLGTPVGGITSSAQWGSYVTLTTPTGGWTWAKIAALETKLYATGLSGGQGVTVTMVQIEVSHETDLAGGTYYWRARGIDPTGSNTYGAWPTARTFTVSSGPAIPPLPIRRIQQAVNRGSSY